VYKASFLIEKTILRLECAKHTLLEKSDESKSISKKNLPQLQSD